MNKQLYRLIKNVQVPSFIGYDKHTGEVLSDARPLKAYYSFIWPNGAPCIIAEMYLLDKSRTVKVNHKDGGTLGNYASQISHLIRFIFLKKRDFIDLTHKDIDDLIDELCNEKNIYNERVRNNDTVKKIISSSIDFLIWIQKNFARNRKIVGLNSEHHRYQIKLVKTSHIRSNGYTVTNEVFPMAIPQATTPLVRPISHIIIKKIWTTLGELKSTAVLNKNLTSKFTKKQQIEHLEYMHKRRELQLILLEATGLRPQELITIEVSSNIDNLSNSQLSIPTLKGRIDSRDNKRLIPIPRSLAMKIELFISVHRKKLIKRLMSTGLITSLDEVDDVIYLNSENGKEVLPSTAYQEFRRLAAKADIKQKTCQSMFRHRFITNMVKIHLIGFMDKNPLKNRHIMVENDYRSILKKNIC